MFILASFERLLLHAICQYMDLASASKLIKHLCVSPASLLLGTLSQEPKS